MLTILVPVGVIIYVLATQTQVQAKPKAHNGLIDLSQWDVAKQGNISLNGQWSFFWNELIDPASYDSTKTPPAVIDVPGIWNGKHIGKETLPSMGFATYVLRVRLNDPDATYALNLHTVSNAYKLWVNDSLIATNGTVGRDASQSIPGYAPKTVVFTPHSRQLVLLLQVSNFAHCKGGAWLPIELGTVAQIGKERETRSLLDMFLFGCLFIMALYHFAVYLLRRKDSTTLFFGLMCAVIGFRSLLTGEILINSVFPDLNWFVARKLEYILTFVSAPIYVTFARALYRKEWNTLIFRCIVYFGLALALFVLVTPTRIYTLTSYVFTAYAWLTGCYTIFVFTRAMLRKQEGAGIFLTTSLFFLLTIVNDTLNQLELIHTGLYLSFGLFIVTFAQSFILSLRFANAFHLSEIYASTFRKFVPAQFMDRIAKDGLESIRAGNAEKAEATVLFSDIRSFTSLAETMTPDEVFTMLNSYLSYVEPPIRANNGFVDKYMGDGIMALFENNEQQNGAANAVQAALDMQAALEKYNAQRASEGKEALRMGIGLHSGSVIIGTLGGNERMDSTAIGDAVNLASRIEGMTKMFGVTLLVSAHTIRQLGDTQHLLLRFVDNVTAKGKTEPVGIWEIIGRRSDNTLRTQAKALPLYEEAMDHYRRQDLVAAKALFERCLSAWPGDAVTEIYIDRCRAGNDATITQQNDK